MKKLYETPAVTSLGPLRLITQFSGLAGARWNGFTTFSERRLAFLRWLFWRF